MIHSPVCSQHPETSNPRKGPFTQTSGNGDRQRRAVVPLGILHLHRSGKPLGISMQMAFPKYTGAIDFPLKTMAPVQRYRKQAGRGSLTSYLDKKTAGQAKEIGQYAQSQSGILEKSLWFLNRAVCRSIARPVRSRCKRPNRKLHVFFPTARYTVTARLCKWAFNGP